MLLLFWFHFFNIFFEKKTYPGPEWSPIYWKHSEPKLRGFSSAGCHEKQVRFSDLNTHISWCCMSIMYVHLNNRYKVMLTHHTFRWSCKMSIRAVFMYVLILEHLESKWMLSGWTRFHQDNALVGGVVDPPSWKNMLVKLDDFYKLPALGRRLVVLYDRITFGYISLPHFWH